MKKVNNSLSTLFCFLTGIGLCLSMACTKDNPLPTTGDTNFGPGTGVFILNEGLFNQGNASIDFFRWQADSLQTDIFQRQNSRPLGDILQSMFIVRDRAYLVVNASQRIEVVQVSDFSHLGTIEGMPSPRYFLPLNEQQAYVSDLSANAVHLVDLQRLEVVDQIAVPGWTEQLLQVGNDVYVTSPSFFGQPPNEQLYIIDTQSHRLVDSIQLAPSPQQIVADGDGLLWVLCAGSSEDNIPGGLFRIDPQQRAVVQELRFADAMVSLAPQLAINDNGTQLYYIQNDLFRMPIHSSALPTTPLLAADGQQWYGLGIRGNEEIWIGDAIDFQQRGQVTRYTMDGSPLDSMTVGFLPNGFYFY